VQQRTLSNAHLLAAQSGKDTVGAAQHSTTAITMTMTALCPSTGERRSSFATNLIHRHCTVPPIERLSSSSSTDTCTGHSVHVLCAKVKVSPSLIRRVHPLYIYTKPVQKRFRVSSWSLSTFSCVPSLWWPWRWSWSSSVSASVNCSEAIFA